MIKSRVRASLSLLSIFVMLFSPLTNPAFAGAVCGTPTVVTLWAGQHIDAGSVTVSNDADNLYITFSTSGDWVLTETHVHVATSLDGIPQTRSGNPQVGKFDYQTTHDPAVTEFTYTIPLGDYEVGTELYIATHAVVAVINDAGEVVEQETAWGDGDGFPGKSWATYFTYTVQECDSGGDSGCTRTQGYWGTHSAYGPAPYDATWAVVGEDTPFYYSGGSWYEAITGPTEGDAYYILSQQFVAARLNIEAGASMPADVQAAFDAAEAWFATEGNVPGVEPSSDTGQMLVEWSAILDDYNNGLNGPPHCG